MVTKIRALGMAQPATYQERVVGEVRAWMGRRHVNQTELADALGVTQAWLSRRLGGQTAISIEDLAMIAQVLDCPITDLLPRLDSNQQPSDYWNEAA